jgi:hypothetical protein
MQQLGEERREFQRIPLDPPLPGTFHGTLVMVYDAGVLGARIKHPATLTATRGELRFNFEGDEIVLRCEIVRTVSSEKAKYPGDGMESGLRFLAAVGDSGDRLRNMLAHIVTKALQEHHDSSATKLHARRVDGDKTVRGADAAFVSYRLEHGTWHRRAVFLPEQPPTGFTVARGEDVEEMQRLCTVFAASDDEGRRLIRLFAELSISDVLQIPPSS